jgi:release factor glutamine methyltransferase
LSKIIKSVLTELNCNIKGTAFYDKETDSMFEAYQKNRTVYFTAILNDKIVGGCGIGMLENNTCELQKMYIIPEARSHKIGYLLLKKCIDFAIENDYDNIYLETFPQMKSAISLYKKNGFYNISNSMGNTCHYSCNVWMLKPLNRSILSLKKEFISVLKNNYSVEESNNLFTILTKKILNINRVDITLNPDYIVKNEFLNSFYDALDKLKQQIPIQYVIGETEFYNSILMVDENVLIPRPETEELVNWIITDCKENNTKPVILDIGTGSGCIAISLARNLNSTVLALDVSKKAIHIASKNAIKNNVKVDFIEKDILKNHKFNFTKKFDIIVSNPPYVRELEKKQMKKNVLEYEPHLALFVKDNDPLLFYKAISDFAKNNLNPNGKLYFEINEYLGIETKKMLQQKGFKNIILKKDIFGKDRMIKCEI